MFGVGLGLALKSWLLGIMFGIIFYGALNETDKKEDSSSEEEEYPHTHCRVIICRFG